MTTTAIRDSAEGEGRGSSVIVNAIAVLRCFSTEEPLLGVTEIASRVGLHKSTVSRIMATFEAENLVRQDPETRRYTLGLGLIAVAGPLLADLEERRVAYPVLQELTERTGETSALMVWDNDESMCVEQIASRHQVKHTTPLGTRYHDCFSSSIQVFLAHEPVERARSLLTNGTITFPGMDDEALEAYLIRLKETSARGYATNYGETSVDEASVAAPVFDHRGNVAAAVLIPAPRFRVSIDTLHTLAAACTDAATKITTRLGGVVLRG